MYDLMYARTVNNGIECIHAFYMQYSIELTIKYK